MQELTLTTENGLPMVHCKSATKLVADAHLKCQKYSIETCGLDPFYSVSTLGYTSD